VSIHDLAARRAASHPHPRHFSEDAELIGVRGEQAFAELTGLPMDTTDRPEGDGGVDFTFTAEHSIDVKTFRNARNLLVEVGKVKADIYVLGQDTPFGVHFVGWAKRAEVLVAPTRDFGYGVASHYIAAGELRPMDALLAMIGRRAAA
jgi:hypothetical protein